MNIISILKCCASNKIPNNRLYDDDYAGDFVGEARAAHQFWKQVFFVGAIFLGTISLAAGAIALSILFPATVPLSAMLISLSQGMGITAFVAGTAAIVALTGGLLMGYKAYEKSQVLKEYQPDF